MKVLLLLVTYLLTFTIIHAQQGVSINKTGDPPEQSAILDISSTSEGILVPRMTAAQREAIPEPSDYLIIFQSDGQQGLYYFNETSWKMLSNGHIISDTDADTKITAEDNPDEDKVRVFLAGSERFRFENGRLLFTNNRNNIKIGDSTMVEASAAANNIAIGANSLENTEGNNNVGIGFQPLQSNSTGLSNIAIGYQVMQANTVGLRNVGIGSFSLWKNIEGNYNVGLGYNTLTFNTSGTHNVGIGLEALYNNTSGIHNVGTGYRALFRNESGELNVAMGFGPLRNNLTGSKNIALGSLSLYSNQSGGDNVAIGERALYSSLSQYGNVAIGSHAMESNVSGSGNVSVGHFALRNNTSGIRNVSVGFESQVSNSDGSHNTSVGFSSLSVNSSGFQNTAIGAFALANSTTENNVAVGSFALRNVGTGSGNTAIGANAGFLTTGSGNVFIGHNAGSISTGSNKLVIKSGNFNPLIEGDFGTRVLDFESNVFVTNDMGVVTIEMLPEEVNGQGAQIGLFNGTGTRTIEIDADHGTNGKGRIIMDELQIRGGSDVSEYFDVTTSGVRVRPGMVVSADPKNPGKLTLPSGQQDRKVVGIVSGANGIETGFMMGQQASIADGDFPIAIAGRVYVYTTEEGGKIEPGDFLTSSSSPGMAMKANIPEAFGSIIGKALTKRNPETGFVLVLVNLL